MPKRLKVLVDKYFPYKIHSNLIEIISINDYNLKWRRLFPPFINLYLLSSNFDIILTARKDGKFLALLYFLIKPARLRHILYEFIYEVKEGLKGIISRLIWIWALKKIDRVFVQSRWEVEYYARIFKTTPKKFAFLPPAINDAKFIGPSSNGYLFSAGRTGRDYKLLISALGMTKIPFVVVASKKDRIFLHKHPKNWQVYFDIKKEEYLKLLSDSKIVVLPLKEGFSSRGQMVILEAMAYGKPVVCSDLPSIRDYIEDGIDGFLVTPNNPQALRNKILSIFDDQGLLFSVGRNGFLKVKRGFMHNDFAENFLKQLVLSYR